MKKLVLAGLVAVSALVGNLSAAKAEEANGWFIADFKSKICKKANMDPEDMVKNLNYKDSTTKVAYDAYMYRDSSGEIYTYIKGYKNCQKNLTLFK